MKTIVVAVFVLLLIYYGPLQDRSSPFDAAWMLGALALLAVAGGQLAQAIRLPALVGWIGAGMLLGTGGLQLVDLGAFSLHQMLFLMAGLGGRVPSGATRRMANARLAPAGVGSVGDRTDLCRCDGGSLHCSGCLGSRPYSSARWPACGGPFTVVPEFGRRSALLLAVLGTGCALVILGSTLVLLETGAAGWVGRVGLSLVAGGGLGLVLRLLGRFATPSATIVSGLVGAFFFAALAVEFLGLMALPCGLVAGLLQDKQQSRRVRLLLHRGAPVAFMLFFALMGTALAPGALWPSATGLYEATLVLVTVPLLLRGLAPMVYYPLPDPHSGRRIGWSLLPRGALLFELFYGPYGLAPYVGAEGLLAQAVLLGHSHFDPVLLRLGIVRRYRSFRGGKGLLRRRRSNGLSQAAARLCLARPIRIFTSLEYFAWTTSATTGNCCAHASSERPNAAGAQRARLRSSPSAKRAAHAKLRRLTPAACASWAKTASKKQRPSARRSPRRSPGTLSATCRRTKPGGPSSFSTSCNRSILPG